MMLRLLLLFLFAGAIMTAAQQKKTGTYSGFVYDAENGEALIGANVFIKELNYGASTNISGYFVIPNVPYGEYTLICSYVGYRNSVKTIDVNGNCDACIEIQLSPETLETEEVVVSADSIDTIEKMFIKPVSKINLTPSQINQIPRVIEADLLRALQTMPGITSLSDFSSALYVRGGTPDQNLYLIDGTDVYNPEHAFGIFSTFNTNAIKKVEVSKGGFGAEYGGRLSSVLDVTNLDGNRNEFEGFANVSLLSASTTLQMPVGNIGSVSGSIRRTYIDQTYSKWIDGVPDYYFYDGNLKGYFDLDNKNKLTISYFHGKDDLAFELDPDEEESFNFDYYWGNTTASINWKHIFNPKLFASFWVTGSRFSSNFDMALLPLFEENYLSDYAVKGALEYYASNEMIVKFGAEQKIMHERYDQKSSEQRIFIENNRQLSTGYISANWKPNPLWSIETGLRVNYFNSDTTFLNFEPRFMAKYRLSQTSNVKVAAGYYHQYLNRLPRLFFASIWATANKYNKESSSAHFILGYQKAFGDLQFEVETYYKTYKNIYRFNQFVGTDIEPTYFDARNMPVYATTEHVFNVGDGASYGVEFLLRKESGALNGWISYSLSRTEYEFDAINQGNTYIPRHDRSSIINLVCNADLKNVMRELKGQSLIQDNSGWKIGLNFVYATGQPLTVPGSGYYSNSLPDQGDIPRTGENDPSYKLYPSDINSYRLPAYIRMDVSVTYEKQYDGWSIAPYLQVFNIGNRKNVWFITYPTDSEGGIITQDVEKTSMLPMLPSLGVNIKF